MTLVQGFEKITLPTIDRLKGSVVKTMGDGLLAVFKHPLNAALAALEIQRQIKAYNEFRMDEERFNVRIGLNTGRVIRKEGDVFGDTVNVASRMEKLAEPGDIYLTPATYEEIKEYIRCTQLGQLEVKGVAGGMIAYSAQESLIDIEKVISEPAVVREAVAGGADAGSLLNLKQSMFKPQFVLPQKLKQEGSPLASLVDLFEDLSTAVEDISENYHDEYVFKRYLQDKWNEILGSGNQEDGSRPSRPAKPANPAAAGGSAGRADAKASTAATV